MFLLSPLGPRRACEEALVRELDIYVYRGFARQNCCNNQENKIAVYENAVYIYFRLSGVILESKSAHKCSEISAESEPRINASRSKKRATLFLF